MKSHILTKSDADLSNFILSLFNEYLLFIDYTHFSFPSNVTLKIFEDDDISVNNGFFSESTEGDKDYILGFKKQFCQPNHRPLIYHEFTHLLDAVELSKNYDHRYFDAITEIRATYVEITTFAGYSSYSNTTIIDKNTIWFFPFANKKESIAKSLESYINHLISIVNNLSDDTTQNYFFLLREMYYYIGFILFIENRTNASVNLLPSINIFKKYFGYDNVVKLYNNRNEIPLSFSPIPYSAVEKCQDIITNCFNYYRDYYLPEYILHGNK